MVKKLHISFKHMTLLLIFLLISLSMVTLFYIQNQQQHLTVDVNNSFNDGFNDKPKDILLNPYAPPLKNENYVLNRGDSNGIPININTQGCDSEYRQTGILTRMNGSDTILPLMTKPLITNKDKWNYYTISDKANNSIKLPIKIDGKSTTTEYGVDRLYDNDIVYVEGFKDTFKVTNYDHDVMKYIPFI